MYCPDQKKESRRMGGRSQGGDRASARLRPVSSSASRFGPRAEYPVNGAATNPPAGTRAPLRPEGEVVAFKGRSAGEPPPDSPESLYRDLPRRPDGVPGLWLHQGDLLRAYADGHSNTSDLALELPTGTGKTIPGLLLADWTRRVRRSRVAYACPTQQLARQVAATAAREGVPHALLIGSHRDWPIADQASYESAGAVAITTYSSVFNSSPKLAAADLLVFDDAHAGEQYVGEAYAVRVNRWDNPGVYQALLDAVAPALDGMLLARLRDPAPDPGAHHQVRLVLPLRQAGMVEAMDTALGRLGGGDAFRFGMIRTGLRACLVYVTYSSLLVRPLIPPTGDNALFTGARQRLYLSATLGNGGELERAFGRAPIHRLALPPTAATPRSGRRFFVFPDLVSGVDPAELTRRIVKLAGKALVLAPDYETAVSRAKDLAQPSWSVLTVDEVKDGMEPFAAADHATLGLANRYDGLDLPGEACRVVVLEGKPDQDNLQERFLSQRVRAGAALAERVRTRVIQGAGRCTRGPNDWAIVVVLGTDLAKYLNWPETQRALDPELQAEIQFGVENSRLGVTEVLDNVRTFLDQGEEWRSEAEPLIGEIRRAAIKESPPGTEALTAAVGAEVEATGLAWHARWDAAARLAQDAAQLLGAGAEATRGYRALWLYLAAVWTDEAGDVLGDAGLHRAARALVGRADEAAKPGTWTRDLPPLPETEPEPLDPHDATAVAAVAAVVDRGVAKGRHDRAVEDMVAGLNQTDPGQYEPALTRLGRLLGADASKPAGSGRCDSAWCWGNALWIAVEAKSDHQPTGVVPHKDVRQANDQLRLLAGDRGLETAPAGSVTVIVSPRPTVDKTAMVAAEDHVHLVHPGVIGELARDAKQAWEDILAGRAGRGGADLRTLVDAALTRHGVLPSHVRDRLTQTPLRSQ